MEVFQYDWLGVFIDVTNHRKQVIINNPDALNCLFTEFHNDIWAGYNNRHYDQYIFKGILLGMDPKKINDFIILQNMEGWQFSREFNRIQMINYDVMPNPPIGLKTIEGFMGSNIKETDVPFDIDRPLTDEEIKQTVKYCTHDVEQTIKKFLFSIDEFNAMYGIVKAFPKMVSIKDIGDSEARITAKVLGCKRQEFNDEFDYDFLPCIQLNNLKYKAVMDWFDNAADDCTREMKELYANAKTPADRFKYDWNDDYAWKKYFYSRSLTIEVAGVPHTFGFGGLHGAPEHPIHRDGCLLHVDVGSYYPSMLIAWDLVTRAATNDNYANVYHTRMDLKAKQIAAKTKEESKKWKKAQLPYKKMLNALSGGMKDKTNPAYDPRNNNAMCINGQLMLLDLLEKLEEQVEGFELIQSNTDGIIIRIPDTDEAFNLVDDICYDWEQRCSTEKADILLELDNITEIYQKDVNNYLWMDDAGKVERIGAYLKELSPIDYDLPIINKAFVKYMVNKVPVEDTINSCNDLIEFQKIVKLSNKYHHVEHEHCKPIKTVTGVRVKKEVLTYPETITYTYKCYRVFASNDEKDGRILKCKTANAEHTQWKKDKFGNTPDHCFIYNDDVNGVTCPNKLDRQWYIDLARKRLKQFGVEV